MDNYTYNFDAKSLDDTSIDQFDAFDNYLLAEGDIDGNNDEEDDHNLFMALDSLDFSIDYNAQSSSTSSASNANIDKNDNNNNVMLPVDVSSFININSYNNGFNSAMTNNSTKFNMNNNNYSNDNTINSQQSHAAKPPSTVTNKRNTNSSLSNTTMTSLSSSTPTIPSAPPQRRASRGRPGFPVHLHDILAQADHAGFSSIISWLPHGRAFVIYDMSKFALLVLPKYFSHNKISTFQRQLKAYKFKRFADGPDKGAYYQEFFIRGRPELCVPMSRIKNKNATSGEIPIALPNHEEPDFYRLPFVDADGEEQPNPSFKALCPTLPTMTFQDNNKKQQTSLSLPPNKIIKNKDNNSSCSSNWQQVLKSHCRNNNNNINSKNNKPFPEKKFPNLKEDKNNLNATTIDNNSLIPLPCHVQEIQIKLKNKSMLPKSDHPLDSVTFFIPLDLLL